MEIIYIGIGLSAGFFAGLLGIGGGGIVAPLLILTFAGFLPAAVATHMAIATSMAIIVVATLPGFFIHAKNNLVQWQTAMLITVGSSFGALAGALFAGNLPPWVLATALAVYQLRAAHRLWRGKKTETAAAAVPKKRLVFLGGGVGIMSSMLGVGGGVICIPYLASRGLNIAQAIGTSACINLPLSFFASAGYIIGGLQSSLLAQHPVDNTWGFIYLPALINTAAFSVIGAFLGANLTARLPDKLLRNLFAALLFTLAMVLLWKTAGQVF